MKQNEDISKLQVYDQRPEGPGIIDRILEVLTGTKAQPGPSRPENAPPMDGRFALQVLLGNSDPGYITDSRVLRVPQFHGPAYDVLIPGVGQRGHNDMQDRIKKIPRPR